MRSASLVAALGAFALMLACGPSDRVRTHEPASLLAPAPSATPAPSAAPAPPPPPPPAPAPTAPKAKFLSVALSAASGKVDKIGAKDGAFSPDGIRDLVFDAEIEGGPIIAFIVVTTDADGRANGSFAADTFVGTQLPPSEADAEVKPGLGTVGIGVYENGKLANAADGSLAPLAEGTHQLTLYISVALPRKASFKVIAVLDDRSMISSPVVPAK